MKEIPLHIPIKYKGPSSPGPFMGIVRELAFQCWNMASNDGASVHRLVRETPNGRVEVMRVNDVLYVSTKGGKEINPLILIKMKQRPAYCTVWDINKEEVPDDIPLNTHTPEVPAYAVFPCKETTISNWLDAQRKTDASDISNIGDILYPDDMAHKWCGRVDSQIASGETLPQGCSWALDAAGEMDTRTDTGLGGWPYNNTIDIEIFSFLNKDNRAPAYSVLASVSAEVEDLNSSIWLRVYRLYDSDSTQGSNINYYWWGHEYEPTYGTLYEKYGFYAVGLPFGEPFHEIILDNPESMGQQYYNHTPPPEGYPWSRNNSVRTTVRARTEIGMPGEYFNNSSISLQMSKYIALHIAHVAYVTEITTDVYDVIYTEVPDPVVTYGNRVDAFKVNLGYNKDGAGKYEPKELVVSGSYDLTAIPAAPADLKTAIEALIDKVYTEESVDENHTFYDSRFQFDFYNET